MTSNIQLNGAPPHLSNHSSNAGNKENQNLTFAENLDTDVTDQLYQAAHSIGKRKIRG